MVPVRIVACTIVGSQLGPMCPDILGGPVSLEPLMLFDNEAYIRMAILYGRLARGGQKNWH